MSESLLYVVAFVLLVIGLCVLVVLAFLPIYAVHVLAVDNNIELFKTLYTILYIIGRILTAVIGAIYIVAGALLFSESKGTGFKAIVSGIISIWYAVWLLPVEYGLIMQMVDNNLSEPLQLAIAKLILIYGIGITLTIDYITIPIERKLEQQ